jgi:hypothetical protein
MARKKAKRTRATKPVAPIHKHTRLKCQIRLAAAKVGIRVQAIAAPDTPPFVGVKILPGEGDPDRVVTLKGGAHAETVLDLKPDEDFRVEVSYGPGKKNSVQVDYHRRRPFGFKAVVASNQAKVDLIGSVPRIR